MINVVLFHLDDCTRLTTVIETESYPLQLHNGYFCLLKLRLQACIKEIRDCIEGFIKSNPSFLDSISYGGYLSTESLEILLQLNDCYSGGAYIMLNDVNLSHYFVLSQN